MKYCLKIEKSYFVEIPPANPRDSAVSEVPLGVSSKKYMFWNEKVEKYSNLETLETASFAVPFSLHAIALSA